MLGGTPLLRPGQPLSKGGAHDPVCRAQRSAHAALPSTYVLCPPKPPKAKKGNQVRAFYTMPEYENWRESLASTTGWEIKYYKVGAAPRPPP